MGTGKEGAVEMSEFKISNFLIVDGHCVSVKVLNGKFLNRINLFYG